MKKPRASQTRTYGKRFAEVYDKLGFSAFSERMIPYINDMLKHFDYRPRSVLDLACGTGTAAVLLAKQGLEVYGVDSSVHMLKVARKKARREKVHIEFSRSDMRSFSLPTKIDLAISLFDSLNYITELNHLTAVFNKVKEHLNRGGFFMFDMNTLYKIKYGWDNSMQISRVGDDLFMINSTTYDENTHTATTTLTIFVKRKGGLFEKICEKHAERGYTVNEIRRALKKAEMTPLNFYECFTCNKPKRETRRIFCVAKNP